MLILVLVLMEAMLPCVIGMLIGMGRTCVFVHHGDKDAFLKGNVEPDPNEVDMVFDSSPSYAELLHKLGKI